MSFNSWKKKCAELHKPALQRYPRIPVITERIRDIRQTDLVEMNGEYLKSLVKLNRGFKYLLTIIDTYSKFA